MLLLEAIPKFTRKAVTRPEAVRFGALAWLAAPAVEVLLATAGLKSTLAIVERLTPPRGSRPNALRVAEGEPVVRWAFKPHIILRGRCLQRALVQYALHRLDGTPARLVIGVRRSEQEPLDAHAWVECSRRSTADESYHAMLTSELSA